MLLYFKTSNNLSYCGETFFSMVAGPYKDLLENTVKNDKYKVRILKSSVIYGANASGKSNLLKAIAEGVLFIQNSFQHSQSDDNLPFRYNLNNNGNSKLPIEYTYGILIEGIHFEYSFSVDRKKILREELSEYRSQKPIQHFLREFNVASNSYDWHFSSFFSGQKETVKSITNERTLFLTIGAQTKLPVAEKVLFWFKYKISWSIDPDSPGNVSADYTLRRLKDSPSDKDALLSIIQDVDFSIKDIEVRETANGLRGTTWHKAKDDDGKDILVGYDLFHEESAGTNRFVAWIGVWLDVLASGKTLLIDELGNSMHTLLSKHLISGFHEPTQNSSQLIFTTHDTNLMSEEIFRKDQIWIVERDASCNSSLYSLSDFKIKKGKVLENSYLQGVFGGIPHIVDRHEKVI